MKYCTAKRLLVVVSLTFTQACLPATVDTVEASAKKQPLEQVLEAAFGTVDITVLQTRDGRLERFRLTFARPPEKTLLQEQLIDYFTQNNHPEGACVQVREHLQGEKNNFEVGVVCLN